MIFGIWALFAEFVRDIAVEAAQENVALRRVRGDKLGRLPYGERPGDRPDLVIAAWNETHSLTGTAQKLNRDGVQTWSGKPWTLTSVRQTMKRVAPGLIPSMGVTVGAKPVSRFALYRLVRCSCGETTTASHRRGGAQVQYQCQKGRVRPGHGRHQVAESVIPPWVQAEAERVYAARCHPVCTNAPGHLRPSNVAGMNVSEEMAPIFEMNPEVSP